MNFFILLILISFSQLIPAVNLPEVDSVISKVIKLKSHSGDPSYITGKPAPDFSFTSFDGKKISLNQFKGKVLLLFFWETWCGKCVNSSLSEVNSLYNNFKEKEIEVLGVSTEFRKRASDLFKAKRIGFINIHGDSKILKNYGVSSRPTYFIIDKKGDVIFVSYGNLKRVKEKLNELTQSQL